MEKVFEDPCKIVILGTRYSGKQLLQQILVNDYNFQKLELPRLQMFLSSPVSSLSNSPRGQQKKIDTTKEDGGVTELCTQVYQKHGVFIMDVPNSKTLQKLSNRNFINVVCIDSPFKIRYSYAKKDVPNLSYQQFAAWDLEFQSEEYDKCLKYVKVNLYNRGTIQDLKAEIHRKRQSIIKPFRPNWDQYFMKIADIARRRSNCMKSAVGCVIVNNQNRVVSTGYNGTPRGLLSCYKNGCNRCNLNSNKALDECLCLHGQESAIIEVGIGRTVGCRLYTTLYPCFSCAKVIKQAGISKIYYMEPYKKKDSGEKFLNQNYRQQDIQQVIIEHVFY